MNTANYFTELKKGEFQIIEELLINSGLIGEEFVAVESKTISKLRNLFNRNRLKVFVCYQNNVIVSFCVIIVKSNLHVKTKYDWHIAYFYTNKSFRRQGIGYKMLTHVFNFLVKTKAGVLSLYTNVDNYPAIALYLKFGFVESKYLGNYNCYTISLSD
ncbi:GNAT family N-acetyltransferase [Neotamlana laminarinivorans]|uniref:GNAT family N-acetyltransferase n=1 Tax=Neotamlana laminarinivorans TaxID=2883124 RepID=A0A9X1I182_9FLAO|nr:GNAT family N-acetyltransferase [Tamlana laminarinivorans]MCB4798382.1 GNAT family N-acetyltransferase [Tamlana laminarinivorans]